MDHVVTIYLALIGALVVTHAMLRRLTSSDVKFHEFFCPHIFHEIFQTFHDVVEHRTTSIKIHPIGYKQNFIKKSPTAYAIMHSAVLSIERWLDVCHTPVLYRNG